jgi:hypothetical protein
MTIDPSRCKVQPSWCFLFVTQALALIQGVRVMAAKGRLDEFISKKRRKGRGGRRNQAARQATTTATHLIPAHETSSNIKQPTDPLVCPLSSVSVRMDMHTCRFSIDIGLCLRAYHFSTRGVGSNHVLH